MRIIRTTRRRRLFASRAAWLHCMLARALQRGASAAPKHQSQRHRQRLGKRGSRDGKHWAAVVVGSSSGAKGRTKATCWHAAAWKKVKAEKSTPSIMVLHSRIYTLRRQRTGYSRIHSQCQPLTRPTWMNAQRSFRTAVREYGNAGRSFSCSNHSIQRRLCIPD